jgi:AraC-like DNA-binding protein
MNISSRELERRFKKNIGLSPKQIARIYHFQSVLQLKNKSGSSTELAHAAGYYDQSHFIREFRDIAGINPFSFFKEEKELTQTFVDSE